MVYISNKNGKPELVFYVLDFSTKYDGLLGLYNYFVLNKNLNKKNKMYWIKIVCSRKRLPKKDSVITNKYIVSTSDQIKCTIKGF